MACCNRTSIWGGGSGCTAYRLTPTSSKRLLAKVTQRLPCMPESVLTRSNLAVGHSEITCAPVEYVRIEPPSGQTCQQYLGQFINNFGGYVTNPDASSSCQFCSYRTTDEFLQSNSNIFYSHHWRNFGLIWVYIGFNVSCQFQPFNRRRPDSSRLLGTYSLRHDLYLPYSWTCESFLSQTLVVMSSCSRRLVGMSCTIIAMLSFLSLSIILASFMRANLSKSKSLPIGSVEERTQRA
jgi:hypothetical protein